MIKCICKHKAIRLNTTEKSEAPAHTPPFKTWTALFSLATVVTKSLNSLQIFVVMLTGCQIDLIRMRCRVTQALCI